MPQVQTRVSNSNFEAFFNARAIEKSLEELQVHYPEPDYSAMGKHLATMEAMVEKAATTLGQIEMLSDKDREDLKDFSAKLFKVVEMVERSIESTKALPKNVSWREKACTKLEHLANRVEDIAETCALAASKKFVRTIEVEIQSLMNVPADD